MAVVQANSYMLKKIGIITCEIVLLIALIFYIGFHVPIRQSKKVYSADQQYSVYVNYKQGTMLSKFMPLWGGDLRDNIKVTVYDEIEDEIIYTRSMGEDMYPLTKDISFSKNAIVIFKYYKCNLPRPIDQ
ncbi:hypothetical protein D770_05275 [Flammeovirgaceae bacterium 311]|nr:hypothetical protein D770_05275 [Flammeovirgaceae bacterium 311]